MAKAVADHFWSENYSDYVLAVGIGVALPVLRAILDAVVFKVRRSNPPSSVPQDPPGVAPASEGGHGQVRSRSWSPRTARIHSVIGSVSAPVAGHQLCSLLLQCAQGFGFDGHQSLKWPP